MEKSLLDIECERYGETKDQYYQAILDNLDVFCEKIENDKEYDMNACAALCDAAGMRDEAFERSEHNA